MRSCRSTFASVLLVAVIAGSLASAQTRPARKNESQTIAHRVSELTAQAVEALFVRSDLVGARRLANEALRLSAASTRPRNTTLDTLFVEMEAAALQADEPAELDAAVRLCEIHGADADPRVMIAAARILDLAENNTQFRAVVPRIRAILATRSAQASHLRAALLTAAKDGLTGLSMPELAHASGLITDWKLVGPFGKYPNISFDQQWAPENDGLLASAYGDRAVERLHFDDGTFELPNYLPSTGVFYASANANVAANGQYLLRVESPGTLDVYVDNKRVLVKDDRFRARGEIVANSLELNAGSHRVLVKFIPTAPPFRIALLVPEPERPARLQAIASAPEAAYVSAARDYWTGDYGSAIRRLSAMRGQYESAAVDYLLSQAWERGDGNSGESDTLAQSTLKLAPDALAAESHRALSALEQRRFETAAGSAQRILKTRPDDETALKVLASASGQLDWQADATRAYQHLADIHPSCGALQEAYGHFLSLSDFNRADKFQQQLATCAPGSLAWAKSLSNEGRHTEAAAALKKLLATRPLDRKTRELLVRELALAGDRDEALREAEQLTAIAPGSPRFRQMREQLQHGELPAPAPSQMAGFADARQFYSPFRHDALKVIHDASDRHFSGGPAIVLLEEHVARLTPDGHVTVYVHKITRVLDRDGILQYGEVAIPNGASLLALRTIKTDGTIAEPEISRHKATISMPALAPGDTIDEEYILRCQDGGIAEHGDVFDFTFGSFAAPILLSQFVVISPSGLSLQFVPSGNVPDVKVQEWDGQIARTWESREIAQSVAEASMPKAGLLPSIRVLPATPGGWADIRDFYRSELIDAVRIGSYVEATAAQISGTTDEQKVRAAYRFVTKRIVQSSPAFCSGSVVSAENTLAQYTGDRTVALIAIAQALGIQADLVLVRDAAYPQPEAAALRAYTRPLVLVHLRDGQGMRSILLDAETEGIGFGGIAPTIARNDALFVTLKQADARDLIAQLPAPMLDDHSTATGEAVFDSEGNLSATVDIRMGASRSAQLRAILAGVESGNRKHFFEQLAARIFPGATDATGEVHNEFDPGHALEVVVRCRAPHFADFRGQPADLDQLVPALGLRKMYASAGPRRTPLFVDTPLIETTTFNIRLPENMRFEAIPANMAEQNEFGSYSVTFTRESENAVSVRRDFRVPVQLIRPEEFGAFSRFARRIDDAERQRFTVEQLGVSASAVR
jgi:tetratricopeptide (TPR) repeat protein